MWVINCIYLFVEFVRHRRILVNQHRELSDLVVVLEVKGVLVKKSIVCCGMVNEKAMPIWQIRVMGILCEISKCNWRTAGQTALLR